MIGRLLESGRKQLQAEQERIAEAQRARDREEHEKKVQAWQQCWRAAADSIHPDLVEYLSDEMPDLFGPRTGAVVIPLEISGLAPIWFQMFKSTRPGEPDEWAPGTPYLVASINESSLEWCRSHKATGYTDPAYALAVAEERWKAAHEGRSSEEPGEPLPF